MLKLGPWGAALEGVRAGNDGCMGCMVGAGENDGDALDVGDEESKENAELLKDEDDTRVAPKPGPGRPRGDRAGCGFKELGIFGDDGSDCVCWCVAIDDGVR